MDQCPRHLDPSHTLEQRYILVGYACETHSSVVAVGEDQEFEFAYFSRAAALSNSNGGRPRSIGFTVSAGSKY